MQRFMHSNIPGSPVPTPLTKKKFLAHCQQLAEHPGKLSNEYQLLQTLSMDLQMPTNAGYLQANKKKNRYLDILPCTKTWCSNKDFMVLICCFFR